MRILLTAAAIIPLATTFAEPARAASASRLRWERSIYADGAEIPLRSPEGVACNDRGALVVADSGNARLVTFTWKDGVLGGGAQVMLPQLAYPVRVQIDSRGFVLALDRRQKRIVRIGESGNYAGVVTAVGASAPMTPSAFRIGPGDALHVLDVVAARVLVLDPEGKVTREVPLPAGATGITDVEVDSGGRIYVLDAVTATVFVADKGAGAFQRLSEGLKEQVSFPITVTADNRGKLHLVDLHGHAVATLGVDGAFQGRDLALGSAEGAVQYPTQLCVTPDGSAFLADRANHRVQIFAMPR